MANYSQLATDIIENVGGAENVTKVIHCITRLRFTLKDKDKADTAAIEALPGVAGAVYNSNLNQYQVVIGQAVEDVYDEVVEQLGDAVVDDEATAQAVAVTAPANGKKTKSDCSCFPSGHWNNYWVNDSYYWFTCSWWDD